MELVSLLSSPAAFAEWDPYAFGELLRSADPSPDQAARLAALATAYAEWLAARSDLPGKQAELVQLILPANLLFVGVAPRGLVHRFGWPHGVAHIFLVDPDGKIALQLRGRDPAKVLSDPGKWDVTVGGHVRPGSTVFENAARELAEELGLRLNCDLPESALHLVEIELQGPVSARFLNWQVTYHYVLQVPAAARALLESALSGHCTDGEVEALAWFTLEEVLALAADPAKAAGGLQLSTGALQKGLALLETLRNRP